MYCKNCGKEIEESAKFCDGCGTNLQGENVASQRSISKINPIINDCKTISKGFFSKKPDSIIDIAKKDNSKVGILFIIINVLLFGFVSCFNISQVINKFTDSLVSGAETLIKELLGGIATSQVMEQMGGGLGRIDNIPILFELFFPLAILSITIFVVIIAGIYLIQKIKKIELTPIIIIMNRVGISCFPMIITLLANFVIGFIIPYFTVFIFVFGILTSLIFYYECNKELFGNKQPIIEISIVFLTIIIVLAIAVSVGCNIIGDNIVDALSNELGNISGNLLEEGINSYFDGLF